MVCRNHIFQFILLHQHQFLSRKIENYSRMLQPIKVITKITDVLQFYNISNLLGIGNIRMKSWFFRGYSRQSILIFYTWTLGQVLKIMEIIIYSFPGLVMINLTFKTLLISGRDLEFSWKQFEVDQFIFIYFYMIWKQWDPFFTDSWT